MKSIVRKDTRILRYEGRVLDSRADYARARWIGGLEMCVGEELTAW